MPKYYALYPPKAQAVKKLDIVNIRRHFVIFEDVDFHFWTFVDIFGHLWTLDEHNLRKFGRARGQLRTF